MSAPEPGAAVTGHAAYEAYWTRESGFVATPWGEALSPSEREAWEAAAQAAIDVFLAGDSVSAESIREALAAQEQREPWAGSGFAALGTTADLDGDAPDEVRELTDLRSGILGLAADLDRSAAATRPSRKSEIETETAIALRRLLETP